MKFDYSKLNGRIVEVFGTQLNFAVAMGLSERSISLKLNNRVAWKNTEIAKAAKLLKIRYSEIPKYFFRNLVHESWTKKGGSNENNYWRQDGGNKKTV